MPNVFENAIQVGELTRGIAAHEFRYTADCTPSQAVSLLMPAPNAEAYLAPRAGRLHPVFDQSLPEGSLRDALSRMFAKALPVFDDFALLEIVGRSQIGRLRFASVVSDLDRVPEQDLRSLLRFRDTSELFEELLQRYARFSGIAGVQPKILVRDNGSLETMGQEMSPPPKKERITASGTTHIVKSFDSDKLPGLAANEYCCLRAAQAAGLKTAETELSDDGRVLVVKRFDLKADGAYLAFEDGCSLEGRVSNEKYEGSYEQLAKTFSAVVRSPRGTKAELADFFRSLCVSVVVRNGDAHRKNFGVLYDDAVGTVTLAPTYDILTSNVYIPTDTMALVMDGTKRWPDKKRLIRFGVTRCQQTPKEAVEVFESVCDAISKTMGELKEANSRGQLPKKIADGVARIWNEGIAPESRSVTNGAPKMVRADNKALTKNVGERPKISP